MEDINIYFFIHNRIIEHCKKLYDDGHYKQAASEAMNQVEVALKEITGIRNRSGVDLVSTVFGEKVKSIKLKVIFGEDMQVFAENLFASAFRYYRNYCVHDGCNVNEIVSMRIMILASELLDLLGASKLSFTDIGGVDGLIKYVVFKKKEDIKELMTNLCRCTLFDDHPDGLDPVLELGYSYEQVDSLLDVGLMEYFSEEAEGDIDPFTMEYLPFESIGRFEITNLGYRFIESE